MHTKSFWIRTVDDRDRQNDLFDGSALSIIFDLIQAPNTIFFFIKIVILILFITEIETVSSRFRLTEIDEGEGVTVDQQDCGSVKYERSIPGL